MDVAISGVFSNVWACRTESQFPKRTRIPHFHHPGTGRRHLFQFVIFDDDVAVALILEAFDQLGAGDGSTLDLTVEHLFDARMIALMKLVKADGLAAGGSVELDRERDQTESDLAFPNGSRMKVVTSQRPSLWWWE